MNHLFVLGMDGLVRCHRSSTSARKALAQDPGISFLEQEALRERIDRLPLPVQAGLYVAIHGEKSKPPARRGSLARMTKTVMRAAQEALAAAEKPAIAHRDEDPLAKDTKLANAVGLLKRPEGATLPQLMRSMNWQENTVRGFLAGTVRKRLGLPLVREKDRRGVAVYRIT